MIYIPKSTNKYKVHICGIGRCVHWGRKWKRHWYDKKGVCYRCGTTRKDAKKGY